MRVDPAPPQRIAVATAEQAAALLAPFFEGADGEKVAVLHLGPERGLVGLAEYPGSFDAVEVPARLIFAEGLRLGAEGLIVAHNHPSGDPAPSEADLRATRILAETGRTLGIVLHDHLIFAGEGRCMSFRAEGLL